MNYAEKLIEKKFNAEDVCFPGFKKSNINVIKEDDLVLAVLEKNRRIDKKYRKKKMSVRDFETLRDEYAGAFRELVEVCSKANGDVQQGIEAVEKVKTR